MIIALAATVSILAAPDSTLAAKRTAVFVVTQPAAEMPLEAIDFRSAVARETQRLADHWIVQVREVQHSLSCGLDPFASLGFDPVLCGESALPEGVDRTLVFELALKGGRTFVRAAYFDPRHAKGIRYLEEPVAEGQAREAAVAGLFSRLFGHYGRVRLGAELDHTFVFIDGNWIAAQAGEMLVAPGRHSVEIKRGAGRVRLADLVMPEGQPAVIDLTSERLMVAAR